MSPLRRCLYSTSQWSTLHNQFPSATDVKIEDFAPVKKLLQPTQTVENAKKREIYLVAQKKAIEATPAIFDTTVEEIASELAEVQKFLAANKP